MLGSKFHRSVVAPLVLGGMLLAWEGLWDDLAGWLRGSLDSAVVMSDSSSGIDPLGLPESSSGIDPDGQSEYSSGIDPDGQPESSSGIDPNG